MSNLLKINDLLRLRPFEEADKPNLILYLNDAQIAANTLTIPHPYHDSDADNWLKLTAECTATNNGFAQNYAIEHRENGLIGGIGMFLHTGLDGHRDELGYWLAEPFRGQGIMTEVVRHFTAWQFERRPSLHRMEGIVFVKNPASARVLEKAGYSHEGILRKFILKKGSLLDGILLSKLRGED